MVAATVATAAKARTIHGRKPHRERRRTGGALREEDQARYWRESGEILARSPARIYGREQTPPFAKPPRMRRLYPAHIWWRLHLVSARAAKETPCRQPVSQETPPVSPAAPPCSNSRARECCYGAGTATESARELTPLPRWRFHFFGIFQRVRSLGDSRSWRFRL